MSAAPTRYHQNHQGIEVRLGDLVNTGGSDGKEREVIGYDGRNFVVRDPETYECMTYTPGELHNTGPVRDITGTHNTFKVA